MLIALMAEEDWSDEYRKVIETMRAIGEDTASGSSLLGGTVRLTDAEVVDLLVRNASAAERMSASSGWGAGAIMFAMGLKIGERIGYGRGAEAVMG